MGAAPGEADRLRLRSVALGLMLVVAVGLTYAGSLQGDFVSDDLQMVEPNPLLRSLSVANLREIFTTFDDANYMPLKVLSLAVDQAIWGPEPFGYHVTNLMLHIGCALLVLSILLAMGFSRGAAFVVALLWAVHPLQVESVAWISERKNVLSGFFFLAAFRAYVAFSERSRASTYAAMLVLYAVALLSKMNTLVLPAVCLAFEAGYKGRFRWRDAGATLPMFVMGALVAWYNLAGSPTHGEAFHGGSAIVTWMSSAVVVFRYLLHTLIPVGLNARYNVMLYGDPFEPVVLGALLGLAALVITTLWLLRRKRPEAFWLLWFAITLAPMLNIVPFRSMMQDRYMYLALLGPLGLAGGLLDSVTRREARRGIVIAAAVVCIVFASVTHRQIQFWADPVALWVRDAAVRPFRANERVFHPQQHTQKLTLMNEAIEASPMNPTLQTNLGGLYFASQQNLEALARFEEARRLAPDEPYNLINLGRTYLRLNRPRDAELVLMRAAALLPYEFMPCYYLLQLYLREQDAPRARATLDRCAALYDGLDAERAKLVALEGDAQ